MRLNVSCKQNDKQNDKQIKASCGTLKSLTPLFPLELL